MQLRIIGVMYSYLPPSMTRLCRVIVPSLLFFTGALAGQTVNPHPRLFLFPSGSAQAVTLAGLKAKANSGAAEWTTLKARADADVGSYACLTGGMDDGTSSLDMLNVALAYMLSGTTTYRDCAIRLAKATLSLNTPRTVETLAGDGSKRSFTLANPIYNFCLNAPSDATHVNCSKYRINPGYDSIQVNSVSQTVGNSAIDNCASFQVCWTPGSTTLTFTTAPPAAAVINVQHMLGPYFVSTNPIFYNTNDSRSTGTYLAVLFDWLYSSLASTDMTWIAESLRGSADSHAGLFGYPMYYGYSGGAGAGNNGALGGATMFAGMVGLATFGSNPTDNGSTNHQMDLMNGFLDGVVTPNTVERDLRDDVSYFYGQSFGSDGISPEGAEYGIQDVNYVMRTLMALSSATNRDVLATALPNFAANAARFFIAGTSPSQMSGNYFTAQWGDVQTPYRLDENYRFAMLAVQSYLGASTLGDQLRFVIDQKAQSFATFGAAYFDWADMLWHSTTWSKQDPAGSAGPLDLGATRLGLLSAKSDWSANATWLYGINTAQSIDHDHQEALSVSLWRGGTFLIDNILGYGTPNGHLANSPSLNGSVTGAASWNGYSSSWYHTYDQSNPLYPAPVNIFRSDASTNKFAYFSMDATGAYNNAYLKADGRYGEWDNVTAAVRQVAFVKPDYVFVLDRAAYGKHAAYTQKQWIARATPSISTNTWSVSSGGQKVNATSIAPANPLISASQVSSLTPSVRCSNTNEQATTSPAGCASITGYTTRYRVAVNTNNLATSDVSLEAMELMPSTASASPATALSGIDASHVGAIIQASSPAIAVFSKTSAASSSVSWNQSFSGTAHIVVSNLAPGTYSVTGNCTLNCSGQVVGSDGVMYFEGTSGAFSIAQGGAAPASNFCDLNADGAVNVYDVQMVIAQTSAAGTLPCTNGDKNGDGKCDSTDVKIVQDAALGGACTAVK